MTLIPHLRHCVAEFERADLKARLYRKKKAHAYEYEIELRRREKFGVFKTFATLRMLDTPKVVALIQQADHYLNGFQHESAPIPPQTHVSRSSHGI